MTTKNKPYVSFQETFLQRGYCLVILWTSLCFSREMVKINHSNIRTVIHLVPTEEITAITDFFQKEIYEKRKKEKFPLRSLVYTISRPWDQVRTMREHINTKELVSLFKKPLPQHHLLPLFNFPSGGQVQKSTKAKWCPLWHTGIAGKAFLIPVAPSLQNLKLGAGGAVGAWPRITQSIWRSRPQLSFHSVVPCFQSNLLAGEVSHSHQGPSMSLQGHPCRKMYWVMSTQGPQKGRCWCSRHEWKRLHVTFQDWLSCWESTPESMTSQPPHFCRLIAQYSWLEQFRIFVQ